MTAFDTNIALTLQAEDTDAIVTSTTPTAGDIPIDGVLLTGSQAVIPNPAYLILSCAADETGNTFTVVGRDVNGNIVSTSFLGVNGTTTIIEVAYQTVTAFSCDQDCSGAIELGITTQTYSKWVQIDGQRDFLSATGAAIFDTGATATVTMEYGFFSTPYKTSSTLLGIVADSVINADNANVLAPINNPADAVRLKVTAWTDGTVHFCVRQANSGHAGVGG